MKDIYCKLPLNERNLESAKLVFGLVSHISDIVFNGRWIGFKITSFTYPLKERQNIVYFKQSHLGNTNFGFKKSHFK